MRRSPLLHMLHPKIQSSTPRIPPLRRHQIGIIAECIRTPRQRHTRPIVIIIPTQLNGTPPKEQIVGSDIPIQLSGFSLSVSAIAGFRRLGRRLTVLVEVRRARDQAVVALEGCPVETARIARLAVHFPVHYFLIGTHEVFPSRPEFVRLVEGIPQKACQLSCPLEGIAHTKCFLAMMRIVRQYGIAQTLITVRITCLGSNNIKHPPRKNIITHRIIRILLLPNLHSTPQRGRNPIRPIGPTPAQSLHVARPPRLSRGARGAFRVFYEGASGGVADAGGTGRAAVVGGAGGGGYGEGAEGGLVDCVGRGVVGGGWGGDGTGCWWGWGDGCSDDFGFISSC
mmetsp:Transcript_14565/g.26404  ORF Transcript_14565/g.26404 Transcript_14565/m.26404 type:complete len:340 (+) Transcript_14565:1573-2592(+)